MAHEPCSACGSTQGPEHICVSLQDKMIGQVLDGRYQVVRVLGQGGMGMVFEALQTSMQRPVALKTLHPSLAAAPQFFERFRREAEVASRLRHPNIITIFDFGRAEDGTCYYVMELLQGESLKQIVKRGGPMTLRRAADIIEQTARGLVHAHNQNVIHRDLKPHNIMVQQIDGQEFVKVLDFGLVKALEQDEDDQLTSTGQVLGTPQYMPPEQAGGEGVDQRSDLYSLAGVFYYCLTGTSPYGANTVRKALQAALTRQVPSVASLRQGAPVPRGLEEFFRKGLAREKEDRHQSAEELIADMRAALAGVEEAVLDAIPSPIEERHGGSGSSEVGGRRSSRGQRTPSSAGSRQRPSSKVIVDSKLATPRKASRSRPTLGDIPSKKASVATPSLEESEAPAPGGRRKVALVAVPLLLLAAGGAVVWGLRTAGASADPTFPTPAPTPAVEALPPPEPPGPAPGEEEITVNIVSTPPGAAVLDEEGVVIGKTPLARRWKKDQVHTVTLQLAGYVDEKKSFKFAADDQLDAQLRPVVTRPPVRPPPKKHDDVPVFE